MQDHIPIASTVKYTQDFPGLTWDDACSVWSTIKSRDPAYIPRTFQDYHGMTSDLPNDPNIPRTSQGCPLLDVGLLSSIPRTPQDYPLLGTYVSTVYSQVPNNPSIPRTSQDYPGTTFARCGSTAMSQVPNDPGL